MTREKREGGKTWSMLINFMGVQSFIIESKINDELCVEIRELLHSCFANCEE